MTSQFLCVKCTLVVVWSSVRLLSILPCPSIVLRRQMNVENWGVIVLFRYCIVVSFEDLYSGNPLLLSFHARTFSMALNVYPSAFMKDQLYGGRGIFLLSSLLLNLLYSWL